MTELRNVAVVLAGGTGTRVGLSIPKQLIRIAGKPIIEHTIAALQRSPLVDEILVLMTPGYLDEVRVLVRHGGYDKVSQVLEGAGTRNDTTATALAALGDEECNVLLHDAVRPLVSQTIIAANVEALRTHRAVHTAIPSADTVVQVGRDSETVADVLPRHLLRRAQTPQSFRLSTIRAAYANAALDPDFTATDDCTVVLRYLPEVDIAVVPGHERNMKVTEPIDVYLAEKLFQLTCADVPEQLSDEQYRARLTGRTLVVFGGSSGIGRDIAELARRYGAEVRTFSRSSSGTHVERREQVAAGASAVLAETGRVDFVVNTAGVLPRGELAGTSEETVHAATDVNYLAPIFIAREFHAALAETHGSLLLLTSSSSTRGRSGYSLHTSAGAAVVGLTQALADEWAGSGVRVNCVNPWGEEPTGSRRASDEVARRCLDVLLSGQTGHVVDLRREGVLAALADG